MDRIERDLAAGFAALRDLGPAVTFFGSARVPPDHPYYAAARDLARRVGERGFADHQRRRPRADGGRQPRRARRRRDLGRAEHRAAVRAGAATRTRTSR